MPSVLITGASGFIGSHLAEEGIARGYEVFAGVRAASSREFLSHPGIRFVNVDLDNPRSLGETFIALRKNGIRPDYVIHNAGITKKRRPGDFSRVNRDGTISLVKALEDTDMMPRKFLFMSTLAAWGPGDPVSLRPVELSDPPRPVGRYGRSKREAEEFLISRTDLPYLIFRPTGVYGPREKDYLTIYRTIARGLEIYLGTPEQALSFIYIRDLASMVFMALESDLVRKEYLVSDGYAYTAKEFSGLVKTILGKKTISLTLPLLLVKTTACTLEFLYRCWSGIPPIDTDRYAVFSRNNWVCDAEPLFSDLRFRPSFSLKEGLEETLRLCRTKGLVK